MASRLVCPSYSTLTGLIHPMYLVDMRAVAYAVASCVEVSLIWALAVAWYTPCLDHALFSRAIGESARSDASRDKLMLVFQSCLSC
jgi:hypothetical protein